MRYPFVKEASSKQLRAAFVGVRRLGVGRSNPVFAKVLKLFEQKNRGTKEGKKFKPNIKLFGKRTQKLTTMFPLGS